jgi:outer membrane protein assembly factor BamB
MQVKAMFSILLTLAAFLNAVVFATAQVNVTQFHNHESRDGLYIDFAFTQNAAGKLGRDLNFVGTISGNVYAQPLYIEGGPSGRAMVIVATESNNVYALDADDGTIIWQRNVGEPVSAVDLICTKLDPIGITGTPIVDLASRAPVFDAMITPDGGTTKKHLLLSLNVDTGEINPGWPVDVEATATYKGIEFDPAIQMQRPALGILGNILYTGYGSMRDCSAFHGWLVGVPIDSSDPSSVVTAWAAATNNHGGAIWGVGGIASDGTNPFVTTGNTFSPSSWDDGEAVIRFQPGPIFSGSPADYWAPEDWLTLDSFDFDLGSSGPLLVDVPGATPSHLVVALGKDRNMYLVNRDNLGGISAPIDVSVVASSTILQAAATYRTKQSTYVALRANNDGNTVLSARRITATNPPTIVSAWDVNRGAGGCGSPFVTSTDGTNDMIVWVVGTEDHLTAGDQRLHGYDGDTGAVVYDGGGANELLAGTHFYSTTGIVARGRIYVAADDKVFAFAVPGPSPTPTLTPIPRVAPTPRARPTPAPRPIPPR